MSDKNVILVLKYCIFDRTIFEAIKSMVTYALPNTLMHFTHYTFVLRLTYLSFLCNDQRFLNYQRS